MSEGQEALQIAMQLQDTLNTTSCSLVNVVTDILDCFADASADSSAKVLHDFQKKGGSILMTSCDADYRKQLARCLDEEKIPYMVLDNAQNPSQKIFLYPETCKKQVEQITMNMIINERLSPVVSKEDMYRAYHGNNITSVDNISQKQLDFYLEEFRDTGVTAAIEPSNTDDRFKLYFHLNDKQDVEKAMTKAMFLERDGTLKEAGKRMEKNRDNLEKALSEIRKGHRYIAGGKGEILEHVPKSDTSPDKYRYTDREKRGVLQKKDRLQEKKIELLVHQMDFPVVLTEDEYKKYQGLSAANKERFLMQKQEEAGYSKTDVKQMGSYRAASEKTEEYFDTLEFGSKEKAYRLLSTEEQERMEDLECSFQPVTVNWAEFELFYGQEQTLEEEQHNIGRNTYKNKEADRTDRPEDQRLFDDRGKG